MTHKEVTKYRIEVRRLPLGQTTEDGAFWPVVDDENVGENNPCFWHTEDEARAAAERYVNIKRRLEYRMDGTQRWQS
ncbi:hypothetical protein [Bradyrhizobium elkanii]|uniref:hypothetical protein n=1 Tax=Bradyrhizobium elkanii TaxID=29448 RepID=UPI003D1FFF20